MGGNAYAGLLGDSDERRTGRNGMRSLSKANIYKLKAGFLMPTFQPEPCGEPIRLRRIDHRLSP